MNRIYQTRGRTREEAAAHIRVGTTKFDQMVADGRMPEPFAIDGRRVWCVYELDAAFDRLPKSNRSNLASEAENPWSRMAA